LEITVLYLKISRHDPGRINWRFDDGKLSLLAPLTRRQ